MENLFDFDEIDRLIDQNMDCFRKEIGDRVRVTDFSSCTHMNGKPLDYENDEEMSFNFITTFVVIETGLNITYDAYYKKYKQNIIIANPLTNMRYRISSGHVQLL